MAATIRIASCLCLVLGLSAAVRAELPGTAPGYYYYPPTHFYYPQDAFYGGYGPYGPPPPGYYPGAAPLAAPGAARAPTPTPAGVGTGVAPATSAPAWPAPTVAQGAAAPTARAALARAPEAPRSVSATAPAKTAGDARYPAVLASDLAQGAFRTELGRFGPLLAAPGGHTLYISTRDPQGVSRCTDGCTRLWSPFLLASSEQPRPPFGAVARADGTRQWSHDGRPLYLWGGDTDAGDVTGDGVDGTWYAIRIAAPD